MPSSGNKLFDGADGSGPLCNHVVNEQSLNYVSVHICI